MARGRPPKPVEQRIAEGNPGRRPLPEPVRPAPVHKAPEPPDHLDKDAKAFWNEAVPVLYEVGILDKVDTAALEMAATAYSRFREAKRVIDKKGILSRGSAGQVVEHPALSTERASQQMYLRFADQYALTPVARTRLGLAELHRRSLVQEMNDAIGEPELTPA